MAALLHAIVLFVIKVSMYIGKSLEDKNFKLTLISVDNWFLRQINDAGDTRLVIQELQCFQTTGLLTLTQISVLVSEHLYLEKVERFLIKKRPTESKNWKRR